MKRFFFDCGTRDAPASLGFLALRVMIGLMMLIGHGLPKIRNYSTLKTFFYVPDFLPVSWAPASLMACIGAEVVASILIIIGFATRPAAFILGFSMVVAAFGRMDPADRDHTRRCRKFFTRFSHLSRPQTPSLVRSWKHTASFSPVI